VFFSTTSTTYELPQWGNTIINYGCKPVEKESTGHGAPKGYYLSNVRCQLENLTFSNVD